MPTNTPQTATAPPQPMGLTLSGTPLTAIHHDGVTPGPTLRDPSLGMLADTLDDLEDIRIAMENRLRTLCRDDDHGHGMTLAHKGIRAAAAILAGLNAKSPVLDEIGYPAELRPAGGGMEHQAILAMNAAVRAHPLWAFAKPQKGVGEKQFARLLACVGDPYWNDGHYRDEAGEPVPYDRPRSVSELWSYCGFGDAAAQRRRRGEKSNWNTDARSRAWLIAESCMKQKEDGQYRKVYDAARAKYADAVHTTECVRCGPKGKPAQPGSPLSLAHQHARGLRAIVKAFLKDLWCAAAIEHHRDTRAA